MANDTLPDIQSRLLGTEADLLYNEKFETWLNLQPSLTYLQRISLLDNWDEENQTYINQRCEVPQSTRLMLQVLYPRIKDVEDLIVSPVLMAKIVFGLLTNQWSVTPSKEDLKIFQDSWTSVQQSVTLQLEHLLCNSNIEFQNLVHDKFDILLSAKCSWPPEIKRVYAMYTFFNKVIIQHKLLFSHMKQNRRWKLAGNDIKSYDLLGSDIKLTLGLTSSILYMGSTPWFLTHPFLLMVHNKLSELLNVLIFSHFQSGCSMPGSHYNLIVKFLKHLSKKIVSFHNPYDIHLNQENRGFVYAKTIEGLGVSMMIERHDTNWAVPNTLLGKSLWKAIVDDKLDKKQEFCDSELYELWSISKTVTIAEMLATTKICGHPSIEVAAGLASLQEKTTKNIPIDPDIRNECIGIMIRDIIFTFYTKHKRYPLIESYGKLPSSIVSMIMDNRANINTYTRNQISDCSLAQWATVVLGKNAELEIIDELELLKDKSLGIIRPQVMELFEFGRLKQRMTVQERRAILDYILTPDASKKLDKYLSKYIDDEHWTKAVLDNLVIKLTSKELELKPMGRFFGASPSVERARRIIQEYNTMSFMDKYEPAQLLTPGELTILEKLVSFRNLKDDYPDHEIINISFDFSSWNNSMRSDSVDVSADAILGRWFGTPMYSKTMLAFQNTLVYYDDGVYKVMWKGQKGGIEGLNQATWSIVFIGGMKLALERLGYTYDVTVKGDDVRAAIIVPKQVIKKQGGFENVRDNILDSIGEICQGMGWKLNPTESFVSSSLIATSKQYLINKTWLPSALKKIKMLESHSNLVYLTMEDLISSVFSIAHASCSTSTTFLLNFILATFSGARILHTNIQSTDKHHLLALNNKIINPGGRKFYINLVSALLLWPQVLGGLGSLPLETFIVRGENDMLSISLSLMRHILTNDRASEQIKNYIRNILKQKIRSGDNRLVVLLGDPYAIDVDCPERPGHILKREIRNILKMVAKNKDMKTLLNFSSERERDKCQRFLITMNPFLPKLAAAIWENTPFALIDEIVAKFAESSSILLLVEGRTVFRQIGRKYNRLLKKLVMAIQARWNYWISTLIMKSDNHFYLGIPETHFLDINRCTSSIAQEIRDTTWGRKIYGITYPCFSEQIVNIMLPNNIVSYSNVVNDNNHQIFSIRPGSVFNGYQLDWMSDHYSHTIGKHHPWLGHKTSSKSIIPHRTDKSSTPLMRKLTKLITIRVATSNISKELQYFIDDLIACYTNVPIDKLRLLAPADLLNHLAHRIQTNSYSLATMPNTRPNISQTMRMARQTNDYLHTDNANRTINYAGVHFYISAIISMDLQVSPIYTLPTGGSTREHLIHFCKRNLSSPSDWCCQDCCAIVDDIPITIDDRPDVNFDRYSLLRMVKCNDADDVYISSSIDKLLSNRAWELRNIISDQVPDEAISEAVRLITSMQYQHAKEIEFNISLAKLGKQALADRLHSSNMEHPKFWSQCNSRDLVDSLLFVMWGSYLTNIIFTNYDVEPIMFKPHDLLISQLSNLIQNVIKGGNLNKIRDGVMSSAYTVKKILHFPYGSEHDSKIVSNVLWRNFYLTFYQWVKNPQMVPDWSNVICGITKEDLLGEVLRRSSFALVNLIRLVLRKYNKSYINSQILNNILTKHLATNLTLINAEDLTTVQIILHVCNSSILLSEEDVMEELDDLASERTMYKSIHELIRNIDNSNDNAVLDSYLITQNLNTIGINILSTEVDSLIENVMNNMSIPLLDLQEVISHSMERIRVWTMVKIHIGTYESIKKIVKSKDYTDESIMVAILKNENKQLTKATILYPEINYHYPLIINNLSDKLKFEKSLFTDESINQGLDLLQSSGLMRMFNKNTREVSSSRIFGSINKSISRYIYLLDVINRFNITWDTEFTVLIIGDGGGNVSQMFLRLWPQCRVVMVTMRETVDNITNVMDAPIRDVPTNLQSEEDKAHLLRFFSYQIAIGDITNVTCVKSLLNAINCQDTPFSLLISDADWYRAKPVTSSFITSLYNIIQILSEHHTFVYMIRWGLNFSNLGDRLLLKWLHAMPNVQIYISRFTRMSEREVFLSSKILRSALSEPLNWNKIVDFPPINNNILEQYLLKAQLAINKDLSTNIRSWSNKLDLHYLTMISSPEEMLIEFRYQMLLWNNCICVHENITFWIDDLTLAQNRLIKIIQYKKEYQEIHDRCILTPNCSVLISIILTKLFLTDLLSGNQLYRDSPNDIWNIPIMRILGYKDYDSQRTNSLRTILINKDNHCDEIKKQLDKDREAVIRLESWINCVVYHSGQQRNPLSRLQVTVCDECLKLGKVCKGLW